MSDLQRLRGLAYLDYTKQLVAAKLERVRAVKFGNEKKLAEVNERIRIIEEALKQHTQDAGHSDITKNDVSEIFGNSRNLSQDERFDTKAPESISSLGRG